MVLEELASKLPKKPEAIKTSHENCESRGKFTDVGHAEFISHLEKAKSDLRAINNDYEKRTWDWVIVKAYYSIHHATNALLVKKKGFYSKDHICAVLALKYFELISENFYYGLREISEKLSDFAAFDLTYSLRKISQYDVRKWKEISESDAKVIADFAKEFVSFVELRCYE